jgi:hypothetical protein
MTSLLSGTKQNSSEGGFFIPVASLIGQIYGRTEPSPAGANTGVNGGSFSTAQWAFWGSKATSSINSAGAGILKDMGRTVVSSLRTFRKVQLVIPGSASTFGVGGPAGQQVGADYFTGYIELGFEGNGTPAPVAQYGR